MKIKPAIIIVSTLLFAGIIFHTINAASDNEYKVTSESFNTFKESRMQLTEREDYVTLIAVGDIMPSRRVAKKIKEKGLDFPFDKISDYFQSGDIVFGNLESPITKGRVIRSDEMVFRAEPGIEIALRDAGFNVLSIANNHTPDFRTKGIKDTLKYLESAGIAFAGAGMNSAEANKPAIIKRNGLTFALLAYNDSDVVPKFYGASETRAGTALMNIETMAESVRAAKEKSDFVIVSMHSGYEYKPKPNKRQTEFAHAAIDAGAELVIGHHPHVVQTMEKYKGKYILYSLGNFVFDQLWSQATREGLIAEITFDDEGVRRIEFLSVYNSENYQPSIIDGERAEKIIGRLKFKFTERKIFAWDKSLNTFKERTRKAVYNDRKYQRARLKKSCFADLDNNSHLEQCVMKDGALKIYHGTILIWESPDNWWVDDFQIADSTCDGIMNINISTWRAGNFGSSKPLWVEENDMSIRNHFFVMKLENGAVKPVWMSSNLPVPNREFAFADVDLDGRQELVVIEGEYDDENQRAGNHVAVWQWDEWGFSNKWRSDKGSYSNLRIEPINGEYQILVDDVSMKTGLN